MNIIIPVSYNDADLLPKSAQVFLHLGQCKGHKLIVAPTENAEQEAHEFKDQVSALFDQAVVRPVKLNIKGWPIAPNRHFRAVCGMVKTDYPDQPFWFFEPDCTPIRKGWLQRAVDTYQNGRKPFCGAIVPTRVTYENGRHGTEGEHMVGTGIYPPDMYDRSAFMQTLDLKHGFSPLPLEPFDVRIRMEVVPHAFNLPELQHNWRTINYKVENGHVVCDDHPDNPDHLSFAKPVADTTYIVHGCRDSSLADLVLKDTFEGPIVVEKKAAPAVHQPAIQTSGFIDFKIKGYIEKNPGKTVKTLASDLELEEDVVRQHIKQGEYAKIGPGGRVNFVSPSLDVPQGTT